MKIIEGKYGVRRNDWEISAQSAHHSAFWRGCLSIKEIFMSDIRCRVGKGDILFWLDTNGAKPLAS